MFPFIETIRIEDGTIYNVALHNERLNATQRAFFGDVGPVDLSDHIVPGLYGERTKCRVEYAGEIINIRYEPYHIRPVASLQPVWCDNIDYAFKSTDRELINELFTLRQECDDILIVKNGLLTDTSIGNVALYDGKRWFTPEQPLLKGTKRRELLLKKQIEEREIRIEDLLLYTHIAVFNAMIDWLEIVLDIGAVADGSTAKPE